MDGDAMLGQGILIRLGRARAVLQETRNAHGLLSAALLFCRILASKGPLLFRQMRAGRKRRALRADVIKGRADRMVDKPYLCFVMTGGLGDYIVIARFIRDLVASTGDITFDIYSPNPDLAAWTFATTPGFRAAYYDILFEHVVAEYDVGFRVNQFVVVYREHIRWRSVRDHRELTRVVESLISFRLNIEPFVDRHPWLDNFLARLAVFRGATRRDFLHMMADLPYGGDRLPILQDTGVVERMGLRPGAYVTVHNGFDTGFVITGRRATKCYPHFGAVVAQIKAARPDLLFVQVGTVTSERIAECELILLNRTSLSEVAGLLAQAAMHLDNEGGLVHLAACLGTRSTVVFGPTPSDFFGYPGNVNIDPPVCGNCWWLTRTWMDTCAKKYATPRCMTEQPPDLVAARALALLAETTVGERDGTTDTFVDLATPNVTEAFL